MKRSKDPSAFIVFGEDGAALAGWLVAFLGVFLGEIVHRPYPDAIAAMVIGLILAAVVIFLAYESKSLLVGETVDLELVSDVETLVQKHPEVEYVRRPLSMQLGPHEVFLALDVQFKPDLSSSRLIGVIDELEKTIRKEHKKVGQIFIEMDRLKKFSNKENHE